MNTIVQTTIIAIALIAGAVSANAAPVNYGNSLMHDTWIGR